MVATWSVGCCRSNDRCEKEEPDSCVLGMIRFYADRKGYLIAADVLIKCEARGIMALFPLVRRTYDVYHSSIEFDATAIRFIHDKAQNPRGN